MRIGRPSASNQSARGRSYHHHIGLNTWESAGGAPPPAGHTGLYHVALLYPDRRELGRAVHRLLDHDYPIDHATDHGGTISVYLSDPDGNGVELYYRELLPTPDNTTTGHCALPDYGSAFLKALAGVAAISTGTRRPISVWEVNARA